MPGRFFALGTHLCWVLIALAPNQVEAYPPNLPAGLPPITEIPLSPDVRPVFYAVAQSPDGAIFAGGIDGIVRYDGRRHQVFRMPNGRLVRSLLHDGQDRLYVGGYGQFGYIEIDAWGELDFTDLTPAAETITEAANLADIWELQIVPEGVIFQALFHAFLYRPDTGQIEVWHHPGRFGALLHHQGQTLLQFRGIGLKQFDGKDFTLIPGGELLPQQVYQLLPLAEGGLLTLARDGQWQRFHDGQLEPWPVPATLLPSSSFQDALVLADHSIVLAGQDGRLHVYDPDGQQHRWYRIATSWISDIIRAVDGQLLVQTDHDTLHIAWPTPWTRIDSGSGLVGSIQGIWPWLDQWVVLTNSGTLKSRQRSPDDHDFGPTGWPAEESWDWWSFDSDRSLLAGSYDLKEVGDWGDYVVVGEDIYPRLIKPSQFDPARIHVGTELGLALFERIEGRWQQRFVQQGFTGRVGSLIELDSHRLLLAVTGTGVVLATYNNDHSGLANWELLAPGPEQPHPDESTLVRLGDGRIILSTNSGLFHWQQTGFEPTNFGGLATLRRPGQVYTIAEDLEGDLWAYSHNHLLLKSGDQDWKVADISSLNPGQITSLSINPGQPVMVGGQASVLLYDRTVKTVERASPGVVLRSVTAQLPNGQLRRLPLDGRLIEVPHDLVNVVFEYALPHYQRPELTRYRARMTGYEEDFSDWGSITRITYANLRSGPMRFEVQARDGQGRLSATDPFEFTVLRPWYRTFWAWLMWVALALALMTAVVMAALRWRLARLTSERERLADMVRQRTTELAAANSKLENMANIDGLTGVANRRRLDHYLDQAWQRCDERRCELAIILIDVDHFKQFNDTHGHQAGDRVLCEVADLLSGSLRRSEDVVARYGGEEFMVVMPAASASIAQTVAEDMRRRIAASPMGVTVSMGIASMRPGADQTLTDLIAQADRALYQAKSDGRNQVRTKL